MTPTFDRIILNEIQNGRFKGGRLELDGISTDTSEMIKRIYLNASEDMRISIANGIPCYIPLSGIRVHYPFKGLLRRKDNPDEEEMKTALNDSEYGRAYFHDVLMSGGTDDNEDIINKLQLVIDGECDLKEFKKCRSEDKLEKLKKIYRKKSLKMHPDKVREHKNKKGHKISEEY